MPDTEEVERTRWPGETDEAFPEVFTRVPPQPTTQKPGQLSEEQIQQYFKEGVIVVEDFFKPEELDACKTAINSQVEELAQQIYKAGKINNLYEEFGFLQRLTKLEEEFPGANIILHKQRRLAQAFRDLWSNERLLNIVEQLIGPNIAGHPIWNVRTKTPHNEATTVPWHQDVGYLDNAAYKVLQPTAWIPLLDATEENGCMEFVNRGHMTGRVCTHQCCSGDTWYVMIADGEMENKLGVDMEKDTSIKPVKYGGFVLFNNMIPHRSLNNISNDIRWSFDFRWQRPDLPFGNLIRKDGVIMRTASDPNHVIDWDRFDSNNQNELTDLDTIARGPHMTRWEIVHHNRHTGFSPKDGADVRPHLGP